MAKCLEIVGHDDTKREAMSPEVNGSVGVFPAASGYCREQFPFFGTREVSSVLETCIAGKIVLTIYRNNAII